MWRALMILFCFFSLKAYAKVEEFSLANGLKIIVKEDHRAPVAVTMLWYDVGSADEHEGTTGLSHALEHLMFKGTAAYPLGFFSKKIASIGGQFNAFTGADYTAYFEKVAATELKTCFELEADRMQKLLLDETEFKKEMQVIEEERRLRIDDNPQALASERYMAAAYLASPYHHPVIGWMNDLKQLTLAEVKDWYQQFYAPNHAILVVVGDVQAKQVYELAKEHFSHLKRGPELSRKKQIEPRALGLKSVEIKTRAKIPMLSFGYGVPSLKSAGSAKDAMALEVIAGLLNAGEGARLPKNLLRGLELATNVEVAYNLYSRHATQFLFFASPTSNHTLAELKAGMLQEVETLKTQPVEESELRRIKTQLIAQKTFEKDSIFGMAMEFGLLETLGLGWQASETYAESLNAVSAKDVQSVAQNYFQTENMTELHLIPAK